MQQSLCNRKTDGAISRVYKMNNDITFWQPQSATLFPASLKTPQAIADRALQLSKRDKQQIIAAYKVEHYEIGLNFLWLRTMAALKRELATVGITLIGEMLGKVDVDEDDDIEDILTVRDTLMLAEELGIVSKTDAMRLRHTYEIINHFSQLNIEERDREDIDESEAVTALKTCVKAILARPKVEVAKTFVQFREALETEAFSSDEEKVSTLLASPYFFWKLTINILMNSAKNSVGAKLEHCLANTNTLLPQLWPALHEAEKWHVGRTYAEVYSDGKKTSTAGLKEALMKVQGFDFVPENLRSDTFIIAAQAILQAHDGYNNFYNEAAPVRKLERLGTSIPVPALSACITALLSVRLGNKYGVSWAAPLTASNILKKLSIERWRYYLDQVLPTDARVLDKLAFPLPRKEWMDLAERYKLADLQINNRDVAKLIKETVAKKDERVERAANNLRIKYYGKSNG